jgi:hypothetical protein
VPERPRWGESACNASEHFAELVLGAAEVRDGVTRDVQAADPDVAGELIDGAHEIEDWVVLANPLVGAESRCPGVPRPRRDGWQRIGEEHRDQVISRGSLQSFTRNEKASYVSFMEKMKINKIKVNFRC